MCMRTTLSIDDDVLTAVKERAHAEGRTAGEVREQREKCRELLAISLSTPQYWPTLELFGWRETGERLRQLVRENRWDLLSSQIHDEMQMRTVSLSAGSRCAPSMM